MSRNTLAPGTRCIDSRKPQEQGVLVSINERVAVVKFKGRRAVKIRADVVRRGPKT